MEQQFLLPENYQACLLVQTINGQQETRLVAIQKAVCERYQQPMFSQQKEIIQPINDNQNFFSSQQQPQQPLYPQQPQYPQLPQQPLDPQPYQPQQPQQPLYPQPYQPQQPEQPNYQQQQNDEFLGIRENFQEAEERASLVSSYNKLCCFTTCYLLVHIACILIQVFLHGSLVAMTLWIISAGILCFSMCCGCCGVRNSSRCIQVIHIFFITIFFALEVVAFAIAINHPVLYELIKPGYPVYNYRLLDTSSPDYTDCSNLKKNYPEYYKEFQSKCEFEIMINENPNYGATIYKPHKTYITESTNISDYTTTLQYGMIAVYSFGLLLALILYVYLCKGFKNLYGFVNQAELQRKFRIHQEQVQQQQSSQRQ